MPATATEKRIRELLAPDERLVFIRGGWLEFYDDRRDTEYPQGGGSHNDDNVGMELNNFRPYRGRYYVYAGGSSDRALNMRRLGAERKAESVGGVLVVQVATRPGDRQMVVGWFRGATAYADWQPRPFVPSRRGEVCAFIAPVDRAVLLPPEEREIPVPKGVPGAMGQSQVRYASDATGRVQLEDWMIGILKEIRQRESGAPRATDLSAPRTESNGLSGQGRGLTAKQRKAVEDFAMARAKEHFGAIYDTVIDTHHREAYDLLCSSRRGGRELRVEVKGTTGDVRDILVTRGEVKSARSHRTALFIVSRVKWADKTTAVLNPGGWNKDVIEPWAPAERDLEPTAYEWRNPAYKKGRQ